MAGEEGIEPSSLVLETSILPLNYSPIYLVLILPAETFYIYDADTFYQNFQTIIKLNPK